METLGFTWGQTWTMIGINIAILGAFGGYMTWIINRVDRDVNNVATKLDTVSARMDARFESQSARTDKLYEMFVDLLKESKK